MSDRRLLGKVAVVTGSARGIGAVTTEVLAGAGARVVVADIDGEGAEKQAEVLRGAGGEAIGVTVDIGDEASVRQLVAAATEAFGRVDVLHNNAASRTYPPSEDRPVHEADIAVWQDILRVNVVGTMLVTKHVLPVMLRAGTGSIVNMSSNAGLAGALGHPAYGASKGAVVRFTRYVATQYGKQGIRCNALAPGLIMTENVQRAVPPGVQDVMLRHHVTPRLGTPDDVAHAVAFLASNEATFITGQILGVDGGMLAHMPYYADEMRLRDEAG